MGQGLPTCKTKSLIKYGKVWEQRTEPYKNNEKEPDNFPRLFQMSYVIIRLCKTSGYNGERTLEIIHPILCITTMTWWKEKKQKKKYRGVTYGRYSSQGRQENSIAIQRDAIHAWAERNDVEIVDEFDDPGKSGLDVKGREGFQALLERVKPGDIDYVICNDPSRWGRFQDPNTFAVYEAKCAEYGAIVKYVVHGDLKKEETKQRGIGGDEGMFRGLIKNMEYTMASKYSFDLSRKVFAGTIKVAQQGFRSGAPAPFGTVRLEVNEQRELVGIMKPKQYKSHPNNRVKLAPDEDGSADVVRLIFDLFVNQDFTEKQIAALLNEQNIPSPRGGKWRTESIRHILQDEQYVGSVVYNKTSSKLKSKTIRNPRDEWITRADSYEHVIDPVIFAKAQEKFNLRDKRMSREEILAKIRPLFNKFGMLSHALLNSLPDMPTKRDITMAFGSLPEAYQSLYPDVIKKVRGDVRKMIETEANDVLECEDFLVINQLFSVKIVPVLPFPHGYGHQWYFRIDKRSCVDITLGVPVRDIKNTQILGYFPFLRVLTDEPLICIADSSSFKIGLYGHLDLHLIFDIIHWTNPLKKETKK